MKTLLYLLFSTAAYAQSTIDWWSVDGGGGSSSGGVFEISGSAGQADAGPAMSGG
ncbi:MAG: hypothetical protein HC845_11655, partial [Akkermansiaceae bacterium]|nr:hypothetical protein [Akkermansiaceae bacterium]